MSTVVAEHGEHQLSLPKYIVGFVGSVLLTLAAYLLVTRSSWSARAVIGTISVLAAVQFMLQLVFFLHIGDEAKPRWKQVVLWFMLGVVVLVVVGSLWIMSNLNTRMNHDQTTQYLKSQDSL
jgi:cytochrome o ubiquinol oxidase subunit IV